MQTRRELKPLGQRLVDRGIIAAGQLESALTEQRRNGFERLLGEILVEKHVCSDEQIAMALAESNGVPFVRVSPRLADPAAVALLPKDYLQRNVALPLFLVEQTLTVAVSEPANMYLAEEIERRSGHRVQLVASPARDILGTLDAYLPNEKMFVVQEGIEDAAGNDFSLPAPPRLGAPATPRWKRRW